jgi:hypothetical protein
VVAVGAYRQELLEPGVLVLVAMGNLGVERRQRLELQIVEEAVAVLVMTVRVPTAVLVSSSSRFQIPARLPSQEV